MKDLIKELEKNIPNPKEGLPDDVFYFIGRHTPYINIDLLVRDPLNGVLLTWRDDIYTGRGWHIPGGIIRFRERWEKRVEEVAKNEINITISKCYGPVAVNQIITNDTERSHFISLLFECEVSDYEVVKLREHSTKNNKKMRFFKKPPENLLTYHNIYRRFIY